MVQFLSIDFFSWISLIFVGFFKSSRFFVSLCILSEIRVTIMIFQSVLYRTDEGENVNKSCDLYRRHDNKQAYCRNRPGEKFKENYKDWCYVECQQPKMQHKIECCKEIVQETQQNNITLLEWQKRKYKQKRKGTITKTNLKNWNILDP